VGLFNTKALELVDGKLHGIHLRNRRVSAGLGDLRSSPSSKYPDKEITFHRAKPSGVSEDESIGRVLISCPAV
jgi:hypothetical protein